MSENAETEEKKEVGDDALSKLLMPSAPPAEPEMRSMTIIGDINEELSKDILAALWFLNHSAKVEELVDPDDPECEELQEVIKPFEIIISTNGGNADEMFAIYDTMRWIREGVEIETFGLGKVMSAGTLLLAAGTKGKRKIGKHCRVMIHSVIGGSIGPMHQLDNEMKEVKSIQESYIKAICEETNLTERKLRGLLKKKVNVYLTAEEAVEYGFADIIV
jgi:ATP-dependent Clp endopeptidase proteolytic subunit ClpP